MPVIARFYGILGHGEAPGLRLPKRPREQRELRAA